MTPLSVLKRKPLVFETSVATFTTAVNSLVEKIKVYNVHFLINRRQLPTSITFLAYNNKYIK